MATTAPTGTVTRPAARTAIGQGIPRSTENRLKVAAPTATSAPWHSDTWPADFTSNPSERKTMTNPAPLM